MAVELRRYRTSDEDAAIALWLETWRKAYPSIDFDARVDWWRARWRDELVPLAEIVVAEQDGAMVGFVTTDATGYLDQLVASPAQWGTDISRRLVDEAKRLAPGGVTLKVNADNVRAIRFYERNGFT
ncbi:MAG: GNAT family N-acetyltransferase, partial [Tardiphaga sp.]|nr:GNAT family N-acetyltransferase [Tardiphaga sp.]